MDYASQIASLKRAVSDLTVRMSMISERQPLVHAPSPLSVYAAGTAYSLTITPALLTFGTTSPTLTINKPGTYLIRARAQVVRNNSTHIADHTVTLKLRRTNNTAADLANAVTAYPDDPHNASNDTEGNWMIPEVIYTTANTDDVIELWGDVSSAGTGGTHDVTEASIIAELYRKVNQ